MVVGRRVLGAFVTALCAGSGLPEPSRIRSNEVDEADDDAKWEKMGREAFAGEQGEDKRREVVEGVLSGGPTGGWCDEQVSFS